MKIIDYILPSSRPSFTKNLRVKGSFLFLSDFEIPYHNYAFINQAIAVAVKYGIRQCVWGGDAVHFESLSPFPGGTNDVSGEISEIEEYLPGFLEPFSKIIWFMGNHDDRAQRALMRKVSNEHALRMILSKETSAEFNKKVTLSEYYWCLADYNWRLTHAKNNAKIPGITAKALAEKYHANVIHAHTHKWGIMQDVAAKYVCIESGCGVDISKLAYVNLRDNTHTKMVNGCVLMLDTGTRYTPLTLNPLVTDWEFELWRAKKQS